ncbi:MAG: L,D-transpeptidase family protein [Candidatus Nanopelagicales bacterium]|nr:L,D-transpeptidase family protein [Candidatus Nanopelagicales bacterium]MCF8551785.1 L,D-transpeptidase family protein [Candidatus Nanopelagicales bacterium]
MTSPRATTVIIASSALLLGVTACTPTMTVSTVPVDPAPIVQLSAFPASSAPVEPDTQIHVQAEQGVLTDVMVQGPDGPVAGILSEDGTQWTASGGPLEYASSYSVVATGADSRGRSETISETITTVQPDKFFRASASPSAGEVVGVGIPIVVTFNKKVDNKAEVEQALEVRTTTPVLGAWAWVSDREIEFRPKDLWPGNTQVELAMNLMGVEAKPGVFGKTNVTESFTYRSAVVSIVDAAEHTMDVYRDGELIRTIPVTTGKPGFETRSGTKVLLSKERSRIMDAATGGTNTSDPEYYRVNAEYAMRLNYTGEFVHAAPWSTGSQGSANVSHGCVGMSTADAQWWWTENNIGDVVIVENTSRIQANDGNGITVWNEPWTQWLSRSASGAQFTKPLQGVSAPVVG